MLEPGAYTFCSVGCQLLKPDCASESVLDPTATDEEMHAGDEMALNLA